MRLLKRLVRKGLTKAGYSVHVLPQRWAPWPGRLRPEPDDEFLEVFARAEPDAAYRSSLKDPVNSKICRAYTLKSFLLAAQPLKGHVAECGVERGLTAYVLAHYLQQCERPPGTLLHLFDSWEGASTPDPKFDSAVARAGMYAASETMVRGRFAPFEFAHLHKGWIPQSLEVVKDEHFSLVHIDLNLYEPIRDAVAFFWPRLLAPGLMLFDDYGFPGSQGARQAVDEFARGQGLHPVYLPTGQGLLLKVRD
jgi:hypothetical protein